HRLMQTTLTGTATEIGSYVYNNNDELTTETATLNNSSEYSTTYGYDQNRSETSVSRTGSNPETDTYTFDFRHMLSSANISRIENGQQVTISATYLYGDDGIRDRT